MKNAILRASALCAGVLAALYGSQAFAAGANDRNTTTPIKHIVVVVGENHSFDSLFATYKPASGQSIKNLLSEGIITANGTPGPNFSFAAQNKATDTSAYSLNPPRSGSYTWLPQPVFELGIPDLRFPFWLGNGPFQITKYVPYSGLGSVTGDPVHRFFQMWQQTGGSNAHHDMFVWVATTTGQGGNTTGVTASTPNQGGELMGYYNMNTGDAPYFKSLAQQYAISDNYHQAVMGGTGMNFFSIATGDLPVYNNNGALAVPPANQIENPDPTPGTNNFYKQDGYNGGSWVSCYDGTQPGAAAINNLLAQQGRSNNCAPGSYYLVNNYNPPYDVKGNPQALGATNYVYPPQTVPTIAESLSAHNVSWKWYTGGREATDFAISILGDGVAPLLDLLVYNNIGDPLVGSKNIMTSSLRNNLQGTTSFFNDLSAGALPAVSFVVPPNADGGHPGQSAPALYENFVQNIVQKIQANPALWAETAIIVTTDEGGGFFDTGDIQQLDFFGDGPRIPLFVVSPFAKKGVVDHTYNDHGSILKLIERNWGLPPLSSRSRDRLPYPVPGTNAYLPANAPAIGDLSSLFSF